MRGIVSAVAGKGGYFVNADGARLGYREGGNPSGPPVLFCYGLICSGYHFRYQWDALAPRYRLLMLDYPGHHVSDAPKLLSGVTFKSLSRDLQAFLDHVHAKSPVHVLAHSMGVSVALELALQAPARVASLMLLAGAARFPARNRRSVERLRRLQEALRLVEGLAPDLSSGLWRLQEKIPGASTFLKRMGFNPNLVRDEDVRECLRVFAQFEPRLFIQLLSEYVRHDLTEDLGAIRIPTLVMPGAKDTIVPLELAQELHARIAGSELAVVEHGSHCPQLDLPDLVNAHLERFLEGAQSARRSNGASAGPIPRAASRA